MIMMRIPVTLFITTFLNHGRDSSNRKNNFLDRAGLYSLQLLPHDHSVDILCIKHSIFEIKKKTAITLSLGADGAANLLEMPGLRSRRFLKNKEYFLVKYNKKNDNLSLIISN